MRGHRMATTDPLKLATLTALPELALETYGLGMCCLPVGAERQVPRT